LGGAFGVSNAFLMQGLHCEKVLDVGLGLGFKT
jgi:hypothetical protein